MHHKVLTSTMKISNVRFKRKERRNQTHNHIMILLSPATEHFISFQRHGRISLSCEVTVLA